jgi:hypothetical protein
MGHTSHFDLENSPAQDDQRGAASRVDAGAPNQAPAHSPSGLRGTLGPLHKAGPANLRVTVLIIVSLLSACSWLGGRRAAPPDAPEILLTGAPRGSLVFVDGVQVAAASQKDESLVVRVAPGAHTVEIHADDKVVYREETYAGPGERRVVTVLSGAP